MTRANSIRYQVLQFAFLVCGLVLVTVGGILFAHHLGQTKSRLSESLGSTARIIAANVSAALAFNEPAAAEEILASLSHDKLIVSAVVYDNNGNPVVRYGQPVSEATAQGPIDPSYAIMVDVNARGDSLGRLLLIADNRAELRRTIITWMSVYGGALVLTALLAFWLASRFQHAVAAPLIALAKTAAEATNKGNYSGRVEPQGPLEVAALATAFNTMLAEVGHRDETLARQLVALDQEIRERKAAQDSLRQNTNQMLRLSHEAGMAEVATGVLHNIGNALTSINVSAELLAEHLHARVQGPTATLRDLFQNPTPKAAEVFAAHPDGAGLRSFAASYAKHAFDQLNEADTELASLRAGVTHLKEIVAGQQSLAKNPRRNEDFDLADAVQEALLIDRTDSHFSLPRLHLERTSEGAAPFTAHGDRSAVVQILINLLTNARAAIVSAEPAKPKINIHLTSLDNIHVTVTVADNGIGIPDNQLLSIFSFGFTTKKGGHGFGLHNAANAARLMGGTIRVHSAGPGRGASFTLALPRHAPGPSQDV